jgi:hypothetical protein
VSAEPTAERFVERLAALVPAASRAEFRRAHRSGKGSRDEGFGIRTGSIFELAKGFIDLPPAEIEDLLDSPVHEVRVGALSVMDKQARRNRTPDDRRKELSSTFTSGDPTRSTRGTSWTWERHTSSGDTSGRGRGRCCTGWRGRSDPRNVAPRS